MRLVLVALLVAFPAFAVEPFDVGGGWRSCPTGYLIFRGVCYPAHDGPVVEYGCTLKGDRQVCPTSSPGFVGNVAYAGPTLGSVGVPSGGVTAIGSFGGLIVIGR